MTKNVEYPKAQTLGELVTERIHDIFLELAEIVNNTTAFTSSEEVSGIPMKLFQGETLLINVWKQYAERELNEQ